MGGPVPQHYNRWQRFQHNCVVAFILVCWYCVYTRDRIVQWWKK